VIALYPALLIAAVALALSRQREGGRGWRWFTVWCVAGALFFFSFLTGLSIGLLLLPFAAAALIFAAVSAPHLPESFGFLAGVGLVVVVVAGLNWGEEHLDSARWLAVGLAITAGAVGAYSVAARRTK
jgi:multidrug transporter EmrE-like cation transporter